MEPPGIGHTRFIIGLERLYTKQSASYGNKKFRKVYEGREIILVPAVGLLRSSLARSLIPGRCVSNGMLVGETPTKDRKIKGLNVRPVGIGLPHK